MRIYLAARYARRFEMQALATELRAMGHEITSRWINGSHEIDDYASPEERARLALEDMEDITSANCVISLTERPREPLDQPGRGGRHVEFGYAMALGKRMIIVGPRENVFHYLPTVEHFDNWGQCKDRLIKETTVRPVRQRVQSTRWKPGRDLRDEMMRLNPGYSYDEELGCNDGQKQNSA